MTQLLMITSAVASGRGMCSISPRRNSTFSSPILLADALAFHTISGVASMPNALPLRTDLLARQEHIHACAAAQVHHHLARRQTREGDRVAAGTIGGKDIHRDIAQVLV